MKMWMSRSLEKTIALPIFLKAPLGGDFFIGALDIEEKRMYHAEAQRRRERSEELEIVRNNLESLGADIACSELLPVSFSNPLRLCVKLS
jgi:hypothetical protein